MSKALALGVAFLAVAMNAACSSSGAAPAPSASAVSRTATPTEAASSTSAQAPAPPVSAPGSAQPSGRYGASFLERSPSPDVERELAHHLMSCVDQGGPSVCPWYLSVTDTPRLDELERRCQANEPRACLLAGLGYQGRGNEAKATELTVRACEGHDALACVYLALAGEVCRSSFRGSCHERYRSYFPAKDAEAILDTECKNGVGVACYGLGMFVYAREDNSFFLLREGCRLGVMGACQRLVVLMDAMETGDANPRRLAVIDTMFQICAEQPVDCAEGASVLATKAPSDEAYFRKLGCDPKLPLHLPADLCR